MAQLVSSAPPPTWTSTWSAEPAPSWSASSPGAVVASGTSLQTAGLEAEIVFLLQGLIFLFVAAGEFFLANRLVLPRTAAAVGSP